MVASERLSLGRSSMRRANADWCARRSPRSANDYLADHRRMDGTEVRERSGLVEGERESRRRVWKVSIEDPVRLGRRTLTDARYAAVAWGSRRHRVSNALIFVRPSDFGSGGDLQPLG